MSKPSPSLDSQKIGEQMNLEGAKQANLSAKGCSPERPLVVPLSALSLNVILVQK